MQRDPAVERGLAAEPKHYRVRLFSLDYLFNRVDVDRHRVDLVGKARVGLYRRDVRVYEYALDPFLGQRLKTLRTGVVEFAASLLAFARFSDFYCPAAKHEDLLYRLIS